MKSTLRNFSWTPSRARGATIVLFGLTAATVLLLGGPARAEIVTYDFTAVTEDVNSDPSLAQYAGPGFVPAGLPVTGSFSYDTTMPADPADSPPGVLIYGNVEAFNPSPIATVNLTVNGIPFSVQDPDIVSNYIAVANTYDTMQMIGNQEIYADGLTLSTTSDQGDFFSLFLASAERIFASTGFSIPTPTLNLANFDLQANMVGTSPSYPGDNQNFAATLTSISLAPEPSSFVLFGLSSIGLLIAVWRRRAA